MKVKTPNGTIIEMGLEKDWSDRCISCRHYDTTNELCKKENVLPIKHPNKSKCKNWRYCC